MLQQGILDKKRVIDIYMTTMAQNNKLREDVSEYERIIAKLT